MQLAHRIIRSVVATTLAVGFAGIAWAQMAPQKVIILVGPPGSGKTTQAQVLAKKYRVPSFSMANLLTKQMSSYSNDPLAKALAASIASGEALPDDAATDLIRLHLLNSNLKKGFILDGYPSTAAQAKALDLLLQEQQLPKAIVVVFDAPDDVIRKRMLGRKRVDDKPENIDRRIKEFRNEAALLTEWAGKTNVVRINANATIANVSTQVVTGLEDAWAHRTFATRK